MRAKRENEIRLTARLVNVEHSGRATDAEPLCMKARIAFEVWVDTDIHTSELVLNIHKTPRRAWWNLWLIGRAKTKAVIGLPPVGHGRIYERTIRASGPPLRDTMDVSGVKGDCPGLPVLELVLISGSPEGTARAIVERGGGGGRSSSDPA